MQALVEHNGLQNNTDLHEKRSSAVDFQPEQNIPKPKKKFNSFDIKHKNKFLEGLHNFTNHKYANPILGLGDVLSAGTDFISLPSPIKKLIDDGSLLTTKTMMVLRYAETGIAALSENRFIEALGRFLGVAVLPLVKLHDLNLASGLAEFIPMIDLSLEGKLGKDKKYKSNGENFSEWTGAFKQSVKEIIQGGFGENCKILPGFNMDQVKQIASNSLKILQGKDPVKINAADEGHTTTLAGILTFVGAAIGVGLGRTQRNIWNKIGGLIRTAGSMLGDYVLFTHPDKQMNKAGNFFIVAGVVDLIQRFLPEKYLNTINHLNIINTMMGGHIVSNRTHQKNTNDFEAYSMAA